MEICRWKMKMMMRIVAAKHKGENYDFLETFEVPISHF